MKLVLKTFIFDTNKDSNYVLKILYLANKKGKKYYFRLVNPVQVKVLFWI